ncbi:hypothetical protein [Helicobacter cynogastricus]|uniref:hypothetical protein n=1 Tax=Helicobacter cynogastricus TaxID=329937 RepID=UPI000CF12290|nr:hypothetical protein [Helicobacter cynogastricus]
MFGFLKSIFYDSIRELFFSDVFISFNLDHEILTGRVEHLKRGKVLEVINRAYAVKDGVIPVKALKDARDFIRTYPFSYLCGMAKSIDQGVCKKEHLEIYAPVPKKELVVLEVDNHCFFIPKTSLKQDSKNFQVVLQKVDYLFSPFLLMYGYIHPMREEGAILYAMLEHSRVCVIVMQRKEVCYSKCHHLETHKNLSTATHETQEDYEQEEALLKSFLNSMEANLASMDTIDGNSSTNSQSAPDLQDPRSLIEDMAHVSDIVEILQESLKIVYERPRYPLEDFVEKVCILNTYQLNPHMVEILRDELMLEVVSIPISITEQLSIFAKREQYKHAL